MKLREKIVVVTGGANGIGRALCRRFKQEGAAGIVVADIDAAGAAEVAREVGGMAVTTNVAIEADVKKLAETAIAKFSRIDLFCSNAGISVRGGEEVAD